MEQPITLVQNGPLTIEIHEGQKGEPGKSLRFEDLTPEQIEQLKGPKGDKGDPGTGADVKEVYDVIVKRGYLPNSSSLNDVLKFIVDKANIIGLFQFAKLEVRVPVKYGDTTIQIGGINVDGLIIKEKGTENTSTINDSTQFSYPFILSHPMDERSVTLEAIWQGEVKSTLVIPGIQANTPVEIASDPAYEGIEGPHNIDYREVDNQLWLRQSNSPSVFKYYDISKLVTSHTIGNTDTVVLDLISEDTIKIASSSSGTSVEYRRDDNSNTILSGNDTLIIEPSNFGVSFNNLIVVYPNKSVDLLNSKTTITFVAPKDMHVGTAVKGTTSVPCIAANEGDVVQFDIMNRTTKIIGTNGYVDHL
jgi:hypothetical protein